MITPLKKTMIKIKWLCIPKINVDEPINNILEQQENTQTQIPGHTLQIKGFHRHFKGDYPTKLIKFTTNDDIAYQTLINRTIQTQNSTARVQPYIDKTSIRCTHCQQIGHLFGNCPNKNKQHICVRCAGWHWVNAGTPNDLHLHIKTAHHLKNTLTATIT